MPNFWMIRALWWQLQIHSAFCRIRAALRAEPEEVKAARNRRIWQRMAYYQYICRLKREVRIPGYIVNLNGWGSVIWLN